MAKLKSDDSNVVLLTKEGLQKLKNELENLKTVGRKEVAARLEEAISYGDLSENAEYDEAKNQQAFIEGRILELEDQIKNAKVIESDKNKKGLIQIGSVVKLRLEETKSENEYTIVGSTEADPIMHKISNESPVGMAILEKKVKDKVSVSSPGGVFNYTILSVK